MPTTKPLLVDKGIQADEYPYPILSLIPSLWSTFVEPSVQVKLEDINTPLVITRGIQTTPLQEVHYPKPSSSPEMVGFPSPIPTQPPASNLIRIRRRTLPLEQSTVVNPPPRSILEPYVDPRLGRVNGFQLRRLRMSSIIDYYEENGWISNLSIHVLRLRYQEEFHDEPPSISMTREVLRSKQFGIDGKQRVMLYKRR